MRRLEYGVIVEDLEAMWPGSRDAWSGQAVRMHWPTFRWARGSYTCYTVGQWDFWSLEGVREGNVHFCGEHTSLDFQGWMEGAAETGAIAAQEILDDLGGASQTKARTLSAAAIARPRFLRRSRRLRLAHGLAAYSAGGE